MRRILALACALGLAFPATASALTVTENVGAAALASNIIGEGINIVGAATFTGAGVSAGIFTGGATAGIGIGSGIVLTTGRASLAADSLNTQDGAGTDNGSAGDAALGAIVAPNQTFDAAILEFDFVTTGGDLFFNYVFASEEYNEYANTQYNDVFAFFLDGENIALLPDGQTPVSINTVNIGNSNPNGDQTQHNPQYFVNNRPAVHAIEYDGFTTRLTAKALGLSAGTHTIRIAIADTGDGVWDSAVFIQANSFAGTQTPPNDVPEPATLALLGLGAGAAIIRRRA